MSQPKVIVRWKCDECAKVVDRLSEVGVSNQMPEGWYYLAWHNTEGVEGSAAYEVLDVTVCSAQCGMLFLEGAA